MANHRNENRNGRYEIECVHLKVKNVSHKV